MSFFKKFPDINYAIDGFSKDVVNLLTAALPRRLNVDKTYVFQTYKITEGQTPESVAAEIYKEANYHWTILIINDIVNPYLDWPLSDEELTEYVDYKYTEGGNAINHFEYLATSKYVNEYDEARYRQMIEDGQAIPFNVTPITNYEFESNLNQAKRDIVVVNPTYISQFVDTFNQAIEGKGT
jgi:hypothetical protein